MIPAILFALLLQNAPAARRPPAPLAARTATVQGKVVAEDSGLPVRYASVQLRRTGAGQETLTVTTDSSGVFAISNIEPGAYSASAAKPGFVTSPYKSVTDDSREIRLSAGQVEADMNFRLPRAAVISGTITDSYGEPVGNANVQAMGKTYSGGRVQLGYRANTQTDDRGEYRLHGLAAGRYYVQVSKRMNGGEAGVALATTLFPGASRLEDAQPIIVKAGEERQGVNVTLPDALLVEVSGRVVDGDTGQPMSNAYVNLIPSSGGGFNASERVQADGSFRFHHVAAGTYRLFVNVSAPAPRNPAPVNFARSLDLTTGSLNDLIIKVGSGSTLKGTVKAEGGALPDQFQLFLVSRGPDGSYGNGSNATIAADGTFEMEHVQPGSYEMELNVPFRQGGEPLPFFVSSASLGKKDVTDGRIEVGDSDSLDLSVIIDLRTATIVGKVLDPEGRPLPKIDVAVISADPKKRLMSGYFHRVSSGRDGAFKVQGLAPGDYLLIAWPGEDAGQVLDPDVFRMIEKYATRITLDRGANVTQDLHLTPELRTVADAFSQ